MPQQFSNNARSALTSSITDTATSMTIESAAADLFPTADTGSGSIPATTDWFKATLQDVSGNVEIIYVRTRTAGSAVFGNVLRGREGTTARSFVSGTVVGLRVTAADIQASINIPGANNTFTGDNTFSGDNTFTGDNTFSGDTTFADPAFTGTPTAPTAATGTSTEQIATTEFCTTAVRALYPVGSIYINAASVTNPSTLLGFGSWVQFAQSSVLVGFDVTNPLYDSLEEVGSISAPMSNTPISGNQKYITVFMWKRTA